MRRVKNAAAVRRLSAKSYTASRTRNRIAVLAIVLTSLLFTAVFTIGLGMVENAQRSNMMQAGGDMHGSIKGISQEQYEKLKTHPLIRESVCDMSIASQVENPEFLKRRLELHYVEPAGYSHWFVEILDGRAPEAADELLMDETSMELLGVKPEAGAQVTLKLRVHYMDPETVERTFTVSGVIRAAKGMNVGFGYVSESYLEAHAQELAPKEEQDDTGLRNMGVVFANSLNIQEKLNRVITESGYSTENQSPDYIDSNANWAYLSDGAAADPAIIAGLGGVLALILAASYLIIYNIFQISVRNDIRYYGLLKTIGTTGRQIRRILRGQALRLCVRGIPAGLILGYLAGRLFLPLVLKMNGMQESGAAVSPRPWIFAAAAVFSAVTVLLSVWKPGRIAARVSPVEALRGADAEQPRRKQKKSVNGGRLGRMAFSNLGRNRGRTVLVVCSLSLTAVLLNSIYTMTASFDREGMLSKMILSGALIGNATLWNYNYRPYDEASAYEAGLSETFVEACEGQDWYADGGKVYTVPFGVTMPLGSWEVPDYFERDKNGIPGYWMEKYFMSLGRYREDGTLVSEDLPVVYHGIEPFVLSKMTVIEGERNPERIWEKLQTGGYLIYAADVDDDGHVEEELVKHHAGDRVTLRFGEDTEPEEYEVLSVIKGHSYSLTNRIKNNFEYYVSEDEFLRHFSEAWLMNCLIDAKEGREGEMERFLADYTENAEPAMHYETRGTYAGMAEQMLGAIQGSGTALAGMIGLIGVLNFINTILTSVVTRKREFAMMQAIGMTKRQLIRMLTAEGLCYAALAVFFSVTVSALFSVTVLRAVCGGLWLLRYRFTAVPVLLAGVLFFLLGAGVPRLVYAFRQKQSIVEAIRE